MEAKSEGTGIDLFDFLYEVWVARWPFIGIVVGFVLLGVLSLAPQWLRTPVSARAPAAQSQIAFSVNVLDDPLRRDPARIIADFFGRVSADGELGLSNAEGSSMGLPPSDRTYRVSYSAVSDSGVIAIAAPGAEPGYFERVYSTFQRLCAQQGADLKARQERTLTVVDNILRTGRFQLAGGLADREFLARSYLEMPAVQAGTFCLLNFRMQGARTLPAPSPSSGLTKRIVLSGLVGGMVAVFFVMFRIGIQRKKAKSAASPA